VQKVLLVLLELVVVLLVRYFFCQYLLQNQKDPSFSPHIIVYSKVIKLTFIVILQKSYTSAIN
jgi:hypothetical protein